MSILLVVVAMIGAYLLGSIPVGLLLVRLTHGQDVRDVASGRTGTTNTLRAAGPWVALLTACGDIGKGLLAVTLARTLVDMTWVNALAGVLAVVGHNYSIYIGFQGGAGTATAIGGAIGLWPWNAPLLIGVGLLAIILSRHASVGSITVVAVLPLVYATRAWVTNAPWSHVVHGLGASTLTLWSLRPNIKRLMQGSERVVSLRRRAHPTS